ncbi:MAG: DUF2508 family protein [Oscillospiraceae bacterium]|nr:DUF2508 family protein [Oscillospiraceae bacterium]
MIRLFKKTGAAEQEEENFRRQLLDDLDFVSNRLERIRESYDMTAEPELVDALIYEEKALQSRFDYLIRVAKEKNIKCRVGIRE